MTLHDVTSGNGQKLIQFAQMHDTFVVSTKTDIKRYIKAHGLYLVQRKQVISCFNQKILPSTMFDQCED